MIQRVSTDFEGFYDQTIHTDQIKAIESDFHQRHPQFHKSRREWLATLVGMILNVRSTNLMKLAATLPHAIVTNIGTLHEKEHKEPWIIAMDARPNRHTVLDYGMRWGIENMFSDFKNRDFGLMQSHIQKPKRLERLKKGTLKQALRSMTSLFRTNLRFLRRCLALTLPIPKLWTVWQHYQGE